MRPACEQGSPELQREVVVRMPGDDRLDWGAEVLVAAPHFSSEAGCASDSCSCASCSDPATDRKEAVGMRGGLTTDAHPSPPWDRMRQETARLMAGFHPNLNAVLGGDSAHSHGHRTAGKQLADRLGNEAERQRTAPVVERSDSLRFHSPLLGGKPVAAGSKPAHMGTGLAVRRSLHRSLGGSAGQDLLTEVSISDFNLGRLANVGRFGISGAFGKRPATSRGSRYDSRARTSSRTPTSTDAPGTDTSATYYDPSFCYDSTDLDADTYRDHEVPCCDETCVLGPCQDPTSELCDPSDCTLSRPKDAGKCESQLKGSDGECAALACNETKALPDMDEYAESDIPIGIYDLRLSSSGCDDELKDILRAAWRILMENVDLVVWASCWVDGPGKAGCLYSFITSGQVDLNLGSLLDWLFNVSVEVWIVGTVDLVVAGSTTVTGIIIYAEHDYWQTVTAQWCCGDNTTKACIALDVAATLAHELTHSCAAPILDLGKDPCYDSYLTESVFRWALFNRYPDVANSPCCSSFVGRDDLFAASWPFRDVSSNCGTVDCNTGGWGTTASGISKGDTATSWKYDDRLPDDEVRKEK